MTKFIENRKSNRKITKPIVIIYHADCSDGFGGAWAAWKKFGNKAEYISIQPSDDFVAGLKNKEIYLIDVSYKPDSLKKLMAANKRVTGIDHHISGRESTMMTQNYSFNNNHSGAVLAWKYFHHKKPVPKILSHIEDTDLWKFKIKNTKEIFAYLDLFDFSFPLWDKLAVEIENVKTKKKFVEIGNIIFKYENKLVQRMVSQNAELVIFEGYKTLAVNSPNFSSQIGAALAKILPPIAIIWSERKGKIIVSLRSDGSVDVSALAKKHGGGGHKAASGFSQNINKKLPWKYAK